MDLKFNIDRPKVGDEEIRKHQDFDQLVRRFKEQSIKKARGDESWWKNKKIRYSAVIGGVTVICTVTYLSLFNNNQQQQKTAAKHDKINTLSTSHKKPAAAAFVKAPSPKLKTGYASYKVASAKGATITHSTASRIHVPKNSFVDKKGRDVIGDVTIEYREFHDLADIVLSGVPMAYDSAGIPFNLESAGMFDIRGTQNGEPVFIKKESPLKIELASANPEDRFNQYYLDTVARNWQYLRRDNLNRPAPAQQPAVENKNLQNKKILSLRHDIEKVIPKKIDSVQTLYTRRVATLPRAAAPYKPAKATAGRPSFVLDGNYDEFPELKAFNNMVFEVGPENKNYSKEMHEITWTDIKVSQGPVKGKNYLLKLIHRNRTENLIVYPVLSASDYEKAEQQYYASLAQYESLVEKRLSDEKRLMAEMERKQADYLAEQKRKQAELAKEQEKLKASMNMMASKQLRANFNTMGTQEKTMRMFEVNRFGIFNSDCPHPLPGAQTIHPRFVSGPKSSVIFPQLIYLVDHTQKTVYMFNKPQPIGYIPGHTYSFCLFRNKELYMCGKNEVESAMSRGTAEFNVSRLEDDTDITTFRKALEI